jgi:hypothetical protein
MLGVLMSLIVVGVVGFRGVWWSKLAGRTPSAPLLWILLHPLKSAPPEWALFLHLTCIYISPDNCPYKFGGQTSGSMSR